VFTPPGRVMLWNCSTSAGGLYDDMGERAKSGRFGGSSYG
jgi:hypothetical protein